jgi:MFS transporter, ACS family, hexuronate transporter
MKKVWRDTPTSLMKAGVKLTAVTDRGDRLKWTVCLLLLLATVMNYFDRQVLSLTATKLIAEFHLSEEGFGHVVSAFRYSYAFVQLFGGWIVDAYGARTVFPVAVGIWSMAGILTAFAPTLSAIVGCRFLLGVGEAFNWPCALKTTERLLEPADRPLANGIFNSGTALGAMLAPVVVTISVSKWGWRSPFIFTGALGVVWIFLWLRFTRTRSCDLAGRRTAFARVPAIFAAIARKKSFWLLVTSAVIVNSVSYFLADWIPLYLQTERGFSFGIGNMLSILVYAGLDVGNLITGVFARAATRHGVSIRRARTLSLLASCILMSCAIPVGFTHYRYLALGCIVLTAVGVAGFLVIYLTLVQEVEPLHVGAAAGMLGGLGNLFYGLISPYIGHLADLGQTRLTFLLVGMLPWLAFFTIYQAARMKPIAP